MNFLEAQRLVRAFTGGEPLSFLFAMSGTGEPLALYLRAAAAARGRAADPAFLPFNTLAQSLLLSPSPERHEAVLLLPWDFAPELDWRSGLSPEAVDVATVRERATEFAGRLSRGPATTLFYLPAPTLPLSGDARANLAFSRWIESLAVEAGATLLPAEAFALPSYLASGCPVAGAWLGRVADVVVDALLRPPREPAKVLVTDLDNTLWAGVLAEDGLEGIRHAAEGRGYRHFVYQTMLARLKREGVLLAAVTRNAPDIVEPALRDGCMVIGASDFVAVLASYHAKSAQIRALAAQLNLGLESFVFVDDNPVELSEVGSALPQVHCVAFPERDEALPALLDTLVDRCGRREVTTEDRQRTELYRRRLEGMAPSELGGADLADFLRGLGMSLVVQDRSAGDRTRAVQLINKTNQFNLNGRRVDDERVATILAGGGALYTATLADRTGSHGEILACLLSSTGVVESLVMSCRVFQRRVEHAFLLWLIERAGTGRPLRLAHVATDRNEPLRRFLGGPAFHHAADGLVDIDAERFRADHGPDLGLFALTEPARA